MKWILKRLPPLLGTLFISITIVRVSSFASDSSLTWRILSALFAIGLAVSIFTCSFWLVYEKTKAAAWIGLIFFAIVDGYFNLVETLLWSVEQTRWTTTIEIFGYNYYVYRLADFIYGLFPTAAAAVLGSLTRYTMMVRDNKPKGLWKEVQSLFDGLLTEKEEAVSIPEQPAKEEPETDSLPGWIDETAKNKKHFLSLIKAGKIRIPEKLTGAELAEYVPVSARSAQDWLKAGRSLQYELRIKSQVEGGGLETHRNGDSESGGEIPDTNEESSELDLSPIDGDPNVSKYRRI